MLLLLFNTTRMVPGPPSTGVAIAMDGGMAAFWACNTTRFDTKKTLHILLGQSRKRAKPKAECDRDSEERKKEEAAASRVAPQNVDRGPYRLAL